MLAQNQLKSITRTVTPRDTIRELARTRGYSVRIAEGMSLFFEGDEAPSLYFVEEGILRVSKLLADGRRQIISFAYPGQVLGLTPDNLHHVDCEALTPARVLAMSKSYCFERGDPGILSAALRLTVEELTEMQDHFIMLGQKCALERIASFLLKMAGRSGRMIDGDLCIDLPMPRADIADFLGMTVESVSRAMTRLRKSGVITLPTPCRVCIRDMAAMQVIADDPEGTD